ncbi:MAG: glycosyltransferase family A protein, partial [Rhizomicrobium sp.]
MSGGHNDSKNGDDGEIDVIVRFHNPTRLPELKRCIFSLVGQNYRPIHIILATQRFSPADQASVENALKPFLEGEDGISFTMVNWEKPEPADARSVLLNIGVAAARGR